MTIWTLFYIHLGIGTLLWLPFARISLLAAERNNGGRLMSDDKPLSLLVGLIMAAVWEPVLVITVISQVAGVIARSRIMTTPREVAARERAELERREAEVRKAEAVLREAGVELGPPSLAVKRMFKGTDLEYLGRDETWDPRPHQHRASCYDIRGSKECGQ